MTSMKKQIAKKATGIRFSEPLYEKLLTAAQERDLSVNWIVNRAVEKFLKELLPLDQFTLTREQPHVFEPLLPLPDPIKFFELPDPNYSPGIYPYPTFPNICSSTSESGAEVVSASASSGFDVT